MLALTVRQPWASLITTGLKPVENRKWSRLSIIGQRIAIHAGKVFDEPGRLWVYDNLPGGRIHAVAGGSHFISAIVCTAVVDRFVTDDFDAPNIRPWFTGPIGWVLRDVRAFDPVSCRGAQGLWAVPPDRLDRIPQEAR